MMQQTLSDPPYQVEFAPIEYRGFVLERDPSNRLISAKPSEESETIPAFCLSRWTNLALIKETIDNHLKDTDEPRKN